MSNRASGVAGQGSVDLISLIEKLSEAETSLQRSWALNYKRIHDHKACDFSALNPSIQTLIQEGRQVADSLKGRGDLQYKGIEELVDSVTALWDSFAEHRGGDKFALHNTAGMSQSSPFFAPVTSSSSTPIAQGALRNQQPAASKPTPLTPETPRQRQSNTSGSGPSKKSQSDPLLPAPLRRGSDVSTDSSNDSTLRGSDADDDWELVQTEMNGGTPQGKKGGDKPYDDDRL